MQVSFDGFSKKQLPPYGKCSPPFCSKSSFRRPPKRAVYCRFSGAIGFEVARDVFIQKGMGNDGWTLIDRTSVKAKI